MSTDSFSISEAFESGWARFKENWGVLVPAALAFYAVQFIYNICVNFVVKDYHPLFLFFLVASIVLVIIMSLGYIKMALMVHDGQKPVFKDLFSCYDKVFPAIGIYILITLAVGLGLVLLIVPGIILALKFYFPYYILVDRDTGVIESMKISSRLTKGVKLKLLLFSLFCGAIFLAGILACGVGILVAFPVLMLMNVHVYRTLEARSAAAPTQSAPGPAPVAP